MCVCVSSIPFLSATLRHATIHQCLSPSLPCAAFIAPSQRNTVSGHPHSTTATARCSIHTPAIASAWESLSLCLRLLPPSPDSSRSACPLNLGGHDPIDTGAQNRGCQHLTLLVYCTTSAFLESVSHALQIATLLAVCWCTAECRLCVLGQARLPCHHGKQAFLCSFGCAHKPPVLYSMQRFLLFRSLSFPQNRGSIVFS